MLPRGKKGAVSLQHVDLLEIGHKLDVVLPFSHAKAVHSF